MIVPIYGTNCSGKTSTVKYLLGKDACVKGVEGRDYVVTEGNGYLAFGPYRGAKKAGGADCISKEATSKLTQFLNDFNRRDYIVLVEGFIVDTKKNARRMLDAFPGKVAPIFLDCKHETTLDRLEIRNGRRKEYKNDGASIKNHARGCLKIMAYYVDEFGVRVRLILTDEQTPEQTYKAVEEHICLMTNEVMTSSNLAGV